MKIKKLIASAAAAAAAFALGLGSMGAAAVIPFNLQARAELADKDYNVQAYDTQYINVGANKLTLTTPVDKNGEHYTASGVGRLVIVIEGGSGYVESFTLDSVTADGKAVEFDANKVLTAENDGDYVIEIYDAYGDTAKDPAFDVNSLTFKNKLELGFTLTGESAMRDETETRVGGKLYGGRNSSGRISLSGAAVSFTNSTETVNATVTGNQFWASLKKGDYITQVTKKGYAPRMFKITVDSADPAALENIELHLYGDINGDGTVNTADSMLAIAAAKKTLTLPDYDLTVADVIKDGKVNTKDTLELIAVVKKVKKLSIS